ncbi:hypothetical protein [Thalassobacillus pellis]|uniref:hypothetical protein n=1 Tax=Thalassobacillus pellis TaxID=748008 RepID=UPI0019620762|nr:hypothetical protein [Thalassobacillus pellis]MBM7554316.1 hypothetical protein [Thalassobacillus pellis]
MKIEQPYIDTKREISIEGQKYVETNHLLTLTDSEITSRDYQFSLKNVFDISYRPIKDGLGLLYLHTNRGVFAFKLNTPPDKFIRVFKDLK